MAVAASGCGKKETPPAAVAEAPAVQPAAMPAPAPAVVTVSNISLGKAISADKRITSTGTRFGSKDTIYVSVETLAENKTAGVSQFTIN